MSYIKDYYWHLMQDALDDIMECDYYASTLEPLKPEAVDKIPKPVT